ncbi:Uncharacterized protein FKW44_011418, partial [Caligus rogercresseyi]
QFGEVTDHYPKRNPSNEAAELKYRSYKDIWRDGDYIVEMIVDPNNLPQIVPLQGLLIRLKFKGSKLQCQNCFGIGHTKHSCNNARITLEDYKKAIKQLIAQNKASDNGGQIVDSAPLQTEDPQTENTGDSEPAHEVVSIEDSNDDPPIVEVTEVVQNNITEHNSNVVNNPTNIENNNDVGMISLETNIALPISTDKATEETIEMPQLPVDHEPIVEEGVHGRSRMKPIKSHINPDLILPSRSRSGSLSKRNSSISGISPQKGQTPSKVKKK